MRVIVLRHAALGDTVCTLPVLTGLARRADVTVCLPARYTPLLPPGIRGWDADGPVGLALFGGRLPERFDLGVAWTEAGGEALRSAGVPDVRVGSSRPPAGVSIVTHLGSPVQDLVGDPGPPRIVAEGVPCGRLVLAPGSGGRAKRMPLGWWRGLADQLPGPIVWVRGPAERGESGFGSPCLDDLDVSGLITLAAGCDAWLGADSGPSHLAAAVGARTGVVFTDATDPANWAPPAAAVGRPGTVAAWVAWACAARRSGRRREAALG